MFDILCICTEIFIVGWVKHICFLRLMLITLSVGVFQPGIINFQKYRCLQVLCLSTVQTCQLYPLSTPILEANFFKLAVMPSVENLFRLSNTTCSF